MKKWMLVLFVALFVLPCSREADAAGRKKKDKNAATAKVTEKKSAYDKLFQKESCETVKSNFITLHKVDGKLYFEIPMKYLGRLIRILRMPCCIHTRLQPTRRIVPRW